ncbi:hypothetical protein EAI83_02915 [Blautia sp. aa_0143]|nr:hypothetical protein EAI83_02915 [Blautia sp. aa_0143]
MLNVSRRRQTDELFAFGESASEAAVCDSLSAVGALPATRATARPPVAGGEEREEGKRPSELRVPPLLANPQLLAETKL